MENQAQDPRMSSRDDRDILEVLKFELDFIEQGGYGRSVRTPWRPTSIFQDSPTCLNFSDPARTYPCDQCFLMNFVPPDRRAEAVPCHHIPLTPAGHTVDSIERWAEQQTLEETVKNWLRVVIKQLEEQRSQGFTPRGPQRRLSAQDLARARQALRAPHDERTAEGQPVSGQDRKRILIVDDDEHVLIVLQAMLENEGYDTTTAWGGLEALSLLRSRPFDLVLLDEYLPDLEASAILAHIQHMAIRPLAMVMQAEQSPGALNRFASLGACDVIDKWMARRDISETVRNCLRPAPLGRAVA